MLFWVLAVLDRRGMVGWGWDGQIGSWFAANEIPKCIQRVAHGLSFLPTSKHGVLRDQVVQDAG